MFDDLDDPGFAGPPPDARAAVGARATRIKRQRAAGLVAGLTSVALLLGGVAAGVRTPDDPAGLEPLTTGTPTAQLSPTPSPSATTTPTRTPAATPTTKPRAQRPSGAVVAPPQPTKGPRPSAVMGGRYSRCSPATGLPERGAGPAAELTFAAEFPAEETGLRGTITITNTSTDLYADFHVVPADDGAELQSVAVDDRGNVSGHEWTTRPEPRETRLGYHHVRLGPGEKWATSFTVQRNACYAAPAGESHPPQTIWYRRLPPGSYQMAVGIDWWGHVWRGDPVSPSPEPTPTDGTPSPSPTASPSPATPPADAAYAEGTWGTEPRTVAVD